MGGTARVLSSVSPSGTAGRKGPHALSPPTTMCTELPATVAGQNCSRNPEFRQWRLGDNLLGSILSFHHEGSEDPTYVGKHLYLMSHLTDQISVPAAVIKYPDKSNLREDD